MYNRFILKMLDNDPAKVITPYGIRWRRLIHPLLVKVVPLLLKRKLVILRQDPLPDCPVIFASTHGFGEDAATAVAITDRPSFMVNGSPKQLLYSFDGISAWAIGSIVLDRSDNASRAASKAKMLRALKLGSDVIIYPEGTWNKSPNGLMNPLFPGVYDVAKESGAPVVPIASVLVDDHIYGIRGTAFDITQFDRTEGLAVLRDKLATLRWEVMEQHSHASRDDLPRGEAAEEYWKNHIDSLMVEVEFYDYELEKHTKCVDKSITEPGDAFSHLEKLIPRRENAFLFRKN